MNLAEPLARFVFMEAKIRSVFPFYRILSDEPTFTPAFAGTSFNHKMLDVFDVKSNDRFRSWGKPQALAGEAWTRGLLIRRTIVDGDLAFFTTWTRAGTTVERPAKIEGHRWAIEDSFETTKNELGLDHNETRSWHGWWRHVSLVMLAFAMMAAIRDHANALAPPQKTMRRKTATTRAPPIKPPHR